MGKICLQNIPIYKRVKILGAGGGLLIFKNRKKKILFDFKRQETGNNHLSQIFLKYV